MKIAGRRAKNARCGVEPSIGEQSLLAAVPGGWLSGSMKMVEDRGVVRDADLLGMVPESLLFSLARGVSPDLRTVLRARLSDSLLLGPRGRLFCHRSDRRGQCRL